MVSFLPNVKGTGGFSVWAASGPPMLHNKKKKPINFIILLITKIMHFFWVIGNNLQLIFFLQVYNINE
jgi:hypothetical protein